MNIFSEQPEFVSEDPRSHCPGGVGLGAQLTPELAFTLHRALLPPHLLRGKSILDLGSCLGASGAWCLSHGAKHYTGVEIQQEFVDKSKECLGKYYSVEQWEVRSTSVENFFDENTNKYDVVLAAGVLHGLSDPFGSFIALTNITDLIVIESMHKTIFHSSFISDKTKQLLSQDPNIVNYLENESYISAGDTGMVIPGMKSVLYNGLIPSMGAIKRMLLSLGFSCDETPNIELKSQLPGSYSPVGRFCLHLHRQEKMATKSFGFTKSVENPSNVLREIDWRSISGDGQIR